MTVKSKYQENSPSRHLWNEAAVTLIISDLRGTREALVFKSGDKSFPLVPGSKLDGFESGVYAKLSDAGLSHGDVPFEVSMRLNGSKSINFAPIGRQTEVSLQSTWKDPSFKGAFLPATRKVADDGFSALWQISYYGRSFPQQWTMKDTLKGYDSAINKSLFGVELMIPLDSYRYVERSIKYGILFIVLVFTAFFLFEILASMKVHPLQYTFIGMALCLFYLALLSLSELKEFWMAYCIGGTACSLMISLYSAKILKSRKRGVVIFTGLAVIYGFLYVILMLQDYSLLVGTIGLFCVLGLVMYLTRNIDWYKQDNVNVGEQ